VAELCAHFRAKGIAVLVDGAHAPGSLDVDVEAIGADYYTGNAHKWLCAPRGAAVMWCRRDRQQGLEPLAASHGVNDGFTAAFDWPGTRDPSAWLSIPAAIDFHEAAGAADLRQRNHDVIVTAAQQLAKKLGTVLAAPPDMLASMAAIRLWPDRPLTGPHCAELQRRMQGEQGVVAAFNTVGGTTWMRLSAAIYTETDDLLEAGRRIWRATRKLD
jgi:isopenicillin-N epimerase